MLVFKKPPQGVVSPDGIVSRLANWFTNNRAKQTQMPEPLGVVDQRPAPVVVPALFGEAHYKITRRFDRGSAAYAYDGGRLWYNPIGGGIVTTRPIEPLQPATAQVVNHTAVFWSAQTINAGAQPTLGPLYDPATLDALVGPLAAPAVAQAGFGGM